MSLNRIRERVNADPAGKKCVSKKACVAGLYLPIVPTDAQRQNKRFPHVARFMTAADSARPKHRLLISYARVEQYFLVAPQECSRDVFHRSRIVRLLFDNRAFERGAASKSALEILILHRPTKGVGCSILGRFERPLPAEKLPRAVLRGV